MNVNGSSPTRNLWRWLGAFLLAVALLSSCASSEDPSAKNNASSNNTNPNNTNPNNTNPNNTNPNNTNPNNTNPNNNTEPDVCFDEDRDGAFVGEECDRTPLDCNDNNDAETPGSPEVCDGFDNDCDGTVDEDVTSPACALTQGVCAGASQVCRNGAFGACDEDEYGGEYLAVEDGGEDDDHCDGLDNDCDGQVDEGCPCQGSETIECGLSEGLCEQGVQRCINGQFGPCEEAVEPADELCDGEDNDCDGEMDEALTAPDCVAQDGVCAGSKRSCQGADGWGSCGAAEFGEGWVEDENPELSEGVCDGLDNDCDGQTDEGCACVDGDTRECGLDVGVCQKGTQTCINGQFGDCRGSVDPVDETCDGMDNDCDGQTDEDLEAPGCGLTEGVCQGTVKTCGGEAGWLDCNAETYGDRYRSEEDPDLDGSVCDGADNDCDGVQDENCDCVDGDIQSCGSNIGACQVGTQTCSEGRFGVCEGKVPPTDEICDGIDNDCDGSTDEELLAPDCLLTQGVCAGAKKACGGEEGWEACDAENYGPAYQEEETSCDRRDNDCDGEIDEGCECVDGDIQRCGSDVGACEAGSQTCAGGQWGPCEGEIRPSEEICDGVDNDCDDNTDEIEDLSPPDCAQQEGVCTGAKQTCGGTEGWVACTGAEYGELYDNGEEARCDGRDNNCNGNIDEQCTCQVDDVQVCGSDIGACRQGLQRCVAGEFGECEGEVTAVTETCDGVDNDCDGGVDEELEQLCPLQEGVCAGAAVACAEGAFGSCGVDEYGPNFVAQETSDQCDGLDNDCDGIVDETCGEPEIIINEVLYDEEGRDTGEMSFVELYYHGGFEGTDRLGGLVLEAVNGLNGSVYTSFDLPNDRVPPNNYYLIVGSNAGLVLRDIADLVVDELDFQNGPDSLRLVWNKGTDLESVVDAVAYGNFGEGDFNAGEGSPATDPPAGQSITRDESNTDTNDNAADFVASSSTALGKPSPGGFPLSRIHINLSWGTDNDDLDLHFLEENATWESNGDCYYANRNPEWGNPESIADNPVLERDDISGFGPEFTDLLDPADGRYLVEVEVFSAAADVPVTITVFVANEAGGVESFSFERTLNSEASRYWSVAHVLVDGASVTVEAQDQIGAEPFDNVVVAE